MAAQLLQQKNVDIRRLTQGVRMKDVTTEQQRQHANRLEQEIVALGSQLKQIQTTVEHRSSSRSSSSSSSSRTTRTDHNNVYVDITLSGGGTNHGGADGGADGGGRLETATNSFGKRLEESLEVASRQVEELSDKEHRLWRRDASFEVWRSERHNGGTNSGGSAHSVNSVHSGGEGQEASTGAENEDKNEELDIVEQRLLQLDQSIHAKVSAVAAVATPIRGERNEGEDEEDETFTI